MPRISTYRESVSIEQQHIIGEEHPDRLGDLWDYVEFMPGTYREGLVVKDIAPITGTATAASEAGTNVLHDTGAFANNDLRGAIGYITGGSGAGQTFQILTHTDDQAIVAVFNSDRNQHGWRAALGTNSTYALRIPGRVQADGTATRRTRGVIQHPDPFTVPAGEYRYGYVRKNGIGQGLLDVTGGVDVAGHGLVKPTTGGLIDGAPATLTVATLSQVIGTALFGNPSGSADLLIPVDFDIKNTAVSLRRPKTQENPTFTVK